MQNHILRHKMYNLGAKSCTQHERFLIQFFAELVNCIHFSSRVSTSCSIFALECDWISSFSRNGRKSMYFEKKVSFKEN